MLFHSHSFLSFKVLATHSVIERLYCNWFLLALEPSQSSQHILEALLSQFFIFEQLSTHTLYNQKLLYRSIYSHPRRLFYNHIDILLIINEYQSHRMPSTAKNLIQKPEFSGRSSDWFCTSRQLIIGSRWDISLWAKKFKNQWFDQFQKSSSSLKRAQANDNQHLRIQHMSWNWTTHAAHQQKIEYPQKDSLLCDVIMDE